MPWKGRSWLKAARRQLASAVPERHCIDYCNLTAANDIERITSVYGSRKLRLSSFPEAHASRVTRIAVLNSHPIQYFAPLYAYLNAAPDLDVTALYLSDFSMRGGRDPGF